MRDKALSHPKPHSRIFSITRPVPCHKMPLMDEHPVMNFVDPESGEEYKAQRLAAAWYKQDQISRFVSLICAQEEPEDLRIFMNDKYRLMPGDEIGFYLFKIVD